MRFRKPQRVVERVFLHCSASDNEDHDDVKVIRAWHTKPKPKGRGWSDIGYHYFIQKSGTVQKGRPLGRTPAAQRGHNTGTIAICLHGLEESRFTTAQFRSVIALTRAIDHAYDGQVSFHGHCEVAAKACPVFPYRKVLGLDEHGAIVRPGLEDPYAPGPEPPRTVLRVSDRGEAVVVLQSLLNRHGAALVEDGLFGRGTLEAVLAFQKKSGLVVDGVVGPATWRALCK